MGRRHTAAWRQVTLLNEAVPPQVELPSEIRRDVVRALAELLLAHLSVDAARSLEGLDESEDQS
jgi:hypothetical protein